MIFEEESFRIRGAVFEVYKEMGSGFLESVYQECLVREFTSCEIPFVAVPEIELSYKGNKLDKYYRPDFICYEKIIVEIKAVQTLAADHKAQLLNYLKATSMKLGFLVNFCSYPKVQIERFVL